MINAIEIVREISAKSGESVEVISKRFHAAHFCGWETLRRTVAECVATLFLGRVPHRAEITATECTETCMAIAEGIEHAIISGVLRHN